MFRDQLPGMVGTEGNVSFVRGYSVIIWMQRKGVDYCPVIMRYATVKRELAQDRLLLMYNLGNNFFGQMVYRPLWQKIARTPLKRLCLAKISEAHFDFNAESG